MRVIFKAPGRKPEEREITGSLGGMQKAVGGYIETLTLPGTGLVIVFDEEGRLKGKNRNIVIARAMLDSFMPVGIVGDLFVCASDEDDLRGLNDTEAAVAQAILEACSVERI